MSGRRNAEASRSGRPHERKAGKLTRTSLDYLLQGLIEGKQGAASRLISVLERGNDSEADRIMETAYPRTGTSWVVGVTGPPGVGKSSLINALIHQARREDYSVGAVLVDPTSPVSGGAVLGDRIRMSSFSADTKVFVRSMGTRGSLGGLSKATVGAVRIMDCLEKDFIFVETVGTGQIEIAVCDVADTVALVTMPGAGDVIQSLKAGIEEVNDIFVVNKADRPGVEETILNLEQMLELRAANPDRDFEWREPICPTVSVTGGGVPRLWEAIKEHRRVSGDSAFRARRKKELAQKETIEIILRKLENFFRREVEERVGLHEIIDEIALKRKSPQRASEEVFAKISRSKRSLTELAEGGERDGDD
ncbi:MAG: methylmalonyl Co-A mutase-associated GTPase MeaB [Deltaproteobacteria bacterium]